MTFTALAYHPSVQITRSGHPTRRTRGLADRPVPFGPHTVLQFTLWAGDVVATDDPTLMAGALLSMLPIVALFIVAQRYFAAGPVRSGLK